MAPANSFQVPDFTWAKILFTAIGVSVFWGKWGRNQLQPYLLPAVFDLLPFKGKYKNWRTFFEFVVFLLLGCVVGIGAADPKNAVQAITAGFAWTGVFAHPKSRGG